jgi:hypothetical protein
VSTVDTAVAVVLSLALFALSSFNGIPASFGTSLSDLDATTLDLPSKSNRTSHLCSPSALTTVPYALLLTRRFTFTLGFATSGPWLPKTREPGTKRTTFPTILQTMQQNVSATNKINKERTPSHVVTFDATFFSLVIAALTSRAVFWFAQSEAMKLSCVL